MQGKSIELSGVEDGDYIGSHDTKYLSFKVKVKINRKCFTI